jgi:hypothetical protein
MVRLLALALLVVSCNESFNAGATRHDSLPVDQRNPVILLNDSPFENWMGEYAMLLANSGGPKLVGIIVVTGGINTKMEDSYWGWQDMFDAAQSAGLRDIPVPTTSFSKELVKPASGVFKDTRFSESKGADLIVDESKRLSQPYRPLVVVAGSRLTDVAKAYLMDESVTERVVVVASVGTLTTTGATMGNPNGEMDTWADIIVTTKFKYIQVSARYDSHLEVPDDRVQDLPDNGFGKWMIGKRPKLFDITESSDQVSIAAVGIPGFVAEFENVSPDPAADVGTNAGPPLQPGGDGRLLLVRKISVPTAIDRFWQMLKDRTLFHSNADASVDTK